MGVYAGADGAFTLVEDDGESTDYRTGKGLRTTALSWNDAAGMLSWKVQESQPQQVLAHAFTELYLLHFAEGQGQPWKSSVRAIGASGSITLPGARNDVHLFV